MAHVHLQKLAVFHQGADSLNVASEILAIFFLGDFLVQISLVVLDHLSDLGFVGRIGFLCQTAPFDFVKAIRSFANVVLID